MKCPTCPDVALSMTDRNGIEIDYCPQCRGVWLDRGELDKLLEKASHRAPDLPGPLSGGDFEDRNYRSGQLRPRQRKGWLAEIFD